MALLSRMFPFFALWLSFILFKTCSAADSVNLTIHPSETQEFGDEDVTVTCQASGLEDALSIQYMEIGKESSPLPLASLYPGSRIVRHREFRQDVRTEGHIYEDKNNISDSYFTITLVDPVFVQSGKYICTVVYLDQRRILKTATASSSLTVKPSGNRGIMKTLKKLQEINKQQDIDHKKLTEKLRNEIRLLQTLLAETDEKINFMNETISKLSVENENLAKKDKDNKAIANKLRERINTLEISATERGEEINGLKMTLSEMNEQSQKLQTTVTKGAENKKSCCEKNSDMLKELVTERGKFIKAMDGLICPGKEWKYDIRNGLCKKLTPGTTHYEPPKGWEL